MSPRAGCLAPFVLLALGAVADARPAHKVLVLPLDGNAAPPVRAKFTASVQRLARVLDGKVAPGTTTFIDSATVLGCDPAAPACADTVRATLEVDELIYGSLSTERGQVVLVVRRATRGKPPREVSATLAPDDPPERAEPAILPLFRTPNEVAMVAPGAPLASPIESTASSQDALGSPVAQGPEARSSRPQRTLGIAAVIGGGASLALGLAMWSSASGIQDEIDGHPIATYDDFVRLRDLEDKASSRAWTGNAMVIAGVALAGLGGYLLWRDHRAHRIAIAPAPIEGGAVVTLTVLGGLP